MLRKNSENQHPNTMQHQFAAEIDGMSPFIERNNRVEQPSQNSQKPAGENYQSFGLKGNEQ